MSFRLPTETRSDLQKAAKANGKSITQELLSRLDESFKQDRKNYRDPATKALCFLFSELAEVSTRHTRIGGLIRSFSGLSSWRSPDCSTTCRSQGQDRIAAPPKF